MNFDSIAAWYQWAERGVFGNKLQRARLLHLNAVETLEVGDRVLIVGDGDGRFTEQIFKRRVDLEIHFVEHSQSMIFEAQARVGKSVDLIKWHHCDVRDFDKGGYDMIVTHFFLDCFNEAELKVIITHLVRKLNARGAWIVTDFSDMNHWTAKLLIRSMYLFFRLVSGLKPKKLVSPTLFLENHGMREVAKANLLYGFLYSTLWKLSDGEVRK